MRVVAATELPGMYSPLEIAKAAGVAEADVRALVGRTRELVPHAEAVRVGKMLVYRPEARTSSPASRPLFGMFSEALTRRHRAGLPFAVSSTLHLGLVAVIVLASAFNLSPRAAVLPLDDRPAESMRLVFAQAPGPGGGGGGGGLLQKAPAPKALREGRAAISSPLPSRREPPALRPAMPPPEPAPTPALRAEPLPPIAAPLVAAPADARTRPGVLQQAAAEIDSRGPGAGGGAGSGTGTGLGAGSGSGVGPGSGGGIGGGPYRAGSGIEAPRLLREVKADYTEEARQRALSGDVVLEIVVRRDGSVGDVKVLRGLASGLTERAVQAVRRWQFTPALRQGVAVDVIVEVAVEFKLR